MIQRLTVLLLIFSISIFSGCSSNNAQLSNQHDNKTEEAVEEKENNESEYVNIKYNPSILGKRAKQNLGEEAVKFYVEVLIPSVLNRDKEISVPSSLSNNEKALVTNYFQQNCPLEYFAGTPFFNVNGDKIIFDYSNCINISDEEYKDKIDNMGLAIESIINNNIKKDYNYLDKVLVIYKYLSENTSYNKDVECSDAYGVLVNNEGICGGFAQSMQILLAQLNEDEGYQVEWIPNDYREGHVWNALSLNGDWYYFDTTWENGIGEGKGLKFFAMDVNRRDSGELPKEEYTICPLSLTVSVPTCNTDTFSVLKYCSKYKLELDNHMVKIKDDNNKWYVLNTEDYSIKEE